MNEQINPRRPLRSWILDIPMSVITMVTALRFLDGLDRRKMDSYICVTDASNLMIAQETHSHRKVLLEAAMIMPDGTPLSWISRLRGVRGMRRVCGPGFMLEAFNSSVSTKWRHFLLGGTEDVLKLLEAQQSKQCPKQENWMADHRERLPGVVQIGVGAAFNFHSGKIVGASIVMRKTGFEWLHRLLSEPRLSGEGM